MTAEQMRALLLEWLKSRASRDSLQYENCLQGIDALATNDDHRMQPLTPADEKLLFEVIWDLVLSRVLLPGKKGAGWPYLSVTDHGEEVIKAAKPVPYDPEGYLKSLQQQSPSVHATVVEYVREAVMTFRTSNYLASAVMLGAASERLFDELAASLPETLSDTAKVQQLAAKMKNGKMRDRVLSIVGWCRNFRTHLPGEWSGGERVDDIERLADLIRRRRNDAGHPSDPPSKPSHEQMYSYLMVFPDYCKHLCELIDWARLNQGTLTAV